MGSCWLEEGKLLQACLFAQVIFLFYMKGQTMCKERLLSHQIPSKKKNASLWIELLPSEMLVWTEERVTDRVCLPNAQSENVAVFLNFCYFVWQSATMNGYTSSMYREREREKCIHCFRFKHGCWELRHYDICQTWHDMLVCIAELRALGQSRSQDQQEMWHMPKPQKGHGGRHRTWKCKALLRGFEFELSRFHQLNHFINTFELSPSCLWWQDEMHRNAHIFICIICILASSLHKHKQSRSAVKTFQTSTLSLV